MPVALKAHWKRSKKGNLYRRLPDGATVTMFEKYVGVWSYCVYTDAWGAEYSDWYYESGVEALRAAKGVD